MEREKNKWEMENVRREADGRWAGLSRGRGEGEIGGREMKSVQISNAHVETA